MGEMRRVVIAKAVGHLLGAGARHQAAHRLDRPQGAEEVLGAAVGAEAEVALQRPQAAAELAGEALGAVMGALGGEHQREVGAIGDERKELRNLGGRHRRQVGRRTKRGLTAGAAPGGAGAGDACWRAGGAGGGGGAEPLGACGGRKTPPRLVAGGPCRRKASRRAWTRSPDGDRGKAGFSCWDTRYRSKTISTRYRVVPESR